ncbi:MAG: DUF1848 domain-containing protein [Chloroflexota bacterium]|jgi:hypothetical protein
MIISASYKTDIPTFYGGWFMNRLQAGYCRMVNPYNKRVYRVALDRDSVDGFFFWTKNIEPFMKYLPQIKAAGYPFIVQYTINGYPRVLEQRVVDTSRSVQTFRKTVEEFGTRVAIWRYDTIVISSETPAEFHLSNFRRLAEALQGATDEVVISFAHLYKKTHRNMNWAAQRFGFSWRDPPADEKRQLATQLAEIAHKFGIQLALCSQPEYVVPGTKEARCVDVVRLAEVAGKAIVAKPRGNRKECGCFCARDIGEYDTCPHGCVYCYAVQNRDLAQRRFRQHDPNSEFLFPPPAGAIEADTQTDLLTQLPLFRTE